jgi:hypothetical protein
MDEEKCYTPLDRLGKAFIPRDPRSHCRVFAVQEYDPRGADGMAYYAFLDEYGRVRVVNEFIKDTYVTVKLGGWEDTIIIRQEVEPHTIRPEEAAGGRLPAGLKDYLDYLASIATPRMRWDNMTGRLFRDGEVRLEVRRLEGNDQLQILDALQQVEFSRPVENPYGDEDKLKYAVRDFNDKSSKWAAEHNKKEPIDEAIGHDRVAI